MKSIQNMDMQSIPEMKKEVKRLTLENLKMEEQVRMIHICNQGLDIITPEYIKLIDTLGNNSILKFFRDNRRLNILERRIAYYYAISNRYITHKEKKARGRYDRRYLRD